MKNFHREDLAFSLCGLTCSLCPMQLDGHCPGCGGGAGNQSCAIARCSQKGGYTYCHECPQYPCERYEGFDTYDSFITHQARTREMERMKALGPQEYHTILREKKALLLTLLGHYNDGRRKGLFLTGVNLLELSELREIIKELEEADPNHQQPIKERATRAAVLLEAVGQRQGVTLRLRKKPSQAKEKCKETSSLA